MVTEHLVSAGLRRGAHEVAHGQPKQIGCMLNLLLGFRTNPKFQPCALCHRPYLLYVQ